MQMATDETIESVRRELSRRGMERVIRVLSDGNYNDIFRKQLIDAKILSSDGLPNFPLLHELAHMPMIPKVS